MKITATFAATTLALTLAVVSPTALQAGEPESTDFLVALETALEGGNDALRLAFEICPLAEFVHDGRSYTIIRTRNADNLAAYFEALGTVPLYVDSMPFAWTHPDFAARPLSERMGLGQPVRF